MKLVVGIRDVLVRIRIRTSDYWIQIRIQLRIGLLSSVTSMMQKNMFIFFSSNLPTAYRHIIFSLKILIFC